jgi:hypothetical protein
MGKNPDPGSALNITDHISKSLVTYNGVKNAKILCYGSGSGIRCLFDLGSGTWDGKIRNSCKRHKKAKEIDKFGFAQNKEYKSDKFNSLSV